MKKILLAIIFFQMNFITAQKTDNKVKIFYDCQANFCETTYVKQNLSGVSFVRDRNFADVHIIILTEQNGSGGYKFHLNFTGQNKFKALQQKYNFSVSTDATKEVIRQKLLQYLKLGLVPFWYEKGLADKLTIDLSEQHKQKTEDQWHHWVFKVGGNVWLNGDSNRSNRNLNAYTKATKVDSLNKFSLRLSYNNGRSQYTFNQQKIISEQEYFSLDLYQIWGINQHWSYGVFGNFARSKYSNYDKSFRAYAGLEYNFFPYTESASKSLVLTGKFGGIYNRYFEKTVYNKTKEYLARAKLLLNGNLVKKWGSLYAGVEYDTYLHDFKLYAVGFNIGTNLRIAKGLDFNTNAYYGIQHDQINIAAGNLSLEQTLLAQKQLQSGYNYYFSVGLSYSFGSIYNSIVNPRFDNDNGQGRTCYCF